MSQKEKARTVSSAFTWLDHSESDRRKMQRVIDLFRESDTRDELGIGQVRDVLSDLLFPGTSTIQTRAKYFLLIPWIFLELERRKVSSGAASARGRDLEVALIEALEAGGATTGVIGILARASVKRLPSSVYWHGLGVLGIRRFHGSIEDYYRSLDSFYRASLSNLVSESGEVLDRAPRNWHAGIPDASSDFLTTSTMDLTRVEADYLRDRMRIEIPASMLANLVEIGDETTVQHPWDHPRVVSLPEHIQEQLQHARNFALVMHGASLLYNFMLAEQSERDDLIDTYAQSLGTWSVQMTSHIRELRSWDRLRFWEIASNASRAIVSPTRTFIDRWIDVAVDNQGAVERNTAARDLVEHRERTLKRSQARLANRRALEMWNEASGAAMLSYRWPATQTIVNDISRGLKARPHA